MHMCECCGGFSVLCVTLSGEQRSSSLTVLLLILGEATRSAGIWYLLSKCPEVLHIIIS